MADLAWKAQSPLSRALAPGRSGTAVHPGGIRIDEIDGISLVLVMARRGRSSAVREAAFAHFGVDAPDRPSAVSAGVVTLIWSGPDQFLALAPASDASLEPARSLKAAFGDTASVSDQSHGRVLIRISGNRAVDMLAKVSSIDLDPAVFVVGAAAVTSIDHTNALIWRAADAGGSAIYHMLVSATFAESLWELLVDSAAEFGLEIGASRLA